jgi:hypothetical protein
MYALLGPDGMRAVQEERLFALEKEHYSLVLRVGEMVALGAPPDAPGRLRLERDLDVAATTIEWHQRQLGIQFTADGQRVDGTDDTATGDDGVDTPVGEDVRA